MLKSVLGSVTGTSVKTFGSLKRFFSARDVTALDEDAQDTLPYVAHPRYKLIQHLASGGSSEVFLARKQRRFIALSRYKYAVKICRILSERSPEETLAGAEEKEEEEEEEGFAARREDVVHEVRVLRRLNRSKNCAVVKLLDAFEGPTVDGARGAWMVMEAFSASLAHVHKCNQQPDASEMPWRTVLAIAQGVVRALQFMHSRGVIHVDVKPGNVLLSQAGMVKLCDFGISVILDEEEGEEEEEDLAVVTQVRGTPQYMAPELAVVGYRFGPAVDIWPIGVILYNLRERETLTFGRKDRFGSDSWDEYQVSNAAYYKYTLGDKYLSRQEFLEVANSANAEAYEKAAESYKDHQDYVNVVRKCLVPYPKHGPQDTIHREGLVERATLEEISEWCEKRLQETPELFLRQAVIRCVEKTLHIMQSLESDSSTQPFTL